MANLDATDVTYTIQKVKKLDDGRKLVNAQISFGDGVKTYPASGVPLTLGKLGCPISLDSIEIMGVPNASDVRQFLWDKTNNTVRINVQSGTTPFAYAEAASGTTAIAAASLTIEAIGY